MKPFRPTIGLLVALAAMLGILCTAASTAAALAPQVRFLNRVTDQVRTPVRMAVDRLSNLYVADPRGGGILKFDHTGSFLSRFAMKGVRGVAVTPAGDLVVSQGTSASVLDSTSGAVKFSLGIGAGQFKQATGIAVDDTGAIFVVDSLDNCVQVFGDDGAASALVSAAPGKPENSFGTGGTQAGQFSLPTGISFEKVSKQLAVADTLNGRIQFFANDGTYRRTLGSRGTGLLQFTSPQAVAFEYSKTAVPSLLRLYVVDTFQGEVQVIDPAGAGSALGTIGGYGTAPGKLAVPVDAQFDQASSRLIVANGQGNLTVYGVNITAAPTPDVTPPLLTLYPVPATVSTDSLILSGTVETEALASLSIILKEGAALSAAVVGPISSIQKDGVESFWSTVISGLTPGVATAITVVAKDSAANGTERTAAVTYNPAAVKVTIDQVTSPTNSTTQTLTGTMGTGATVTLAASSAASFGVVTFPTATTWQCSVSGLSEGNNTITATASTPTSSSSSTAVISVVTIAPDLNVSTLPTNSRTSSQILNISGFLPVNAFFDRITLNNQPLEILNNFFSTTLVLTAGSNAVTIKAFDLAGNVATDSRTIVYDPTLPEITIDSHADGATVAGNTLTIRGTAASGSIVDLSINNDASVQAASQPGSGTTWSSSLLLDPGINTVVARATTGAGTASTKVTINSDTSAEPLALAVNVPIRDIPVNTLARTVTGTVSANTAVVATLSGPAGALVTQPRLTLAADGTFSVTPTFTTEGAYTLAVTATDAFGTSVTTYRSLVYDVTAPTSLNYQENPRRVTFSEGTPVARDRSGPLNGVITRNADGSVTIDLSGVTFDAATLDIHTIDGAGNSSRSGSINGNGKVTISDALKALQIATGQSDVTPQQLLLGDVAPLINGEPTPNGSIDSGDVLIILRKVLGLATF